jgi:hypothetical protein
VVRLSRLAMIIGLVGTTAFLVPVAGTPASAATSGPGYWLESRDGGVFAFGAAPFMGSATDQCTLQCWGFGATGDGNGYWVVDNFPAADPSVTKLYGFGDAADVSMPSQSGGATAVASTPSGHGGWVLFGETGTVTPFGDATWLGDGSTISHRSGSWPPFGSFIDYFSGIVSTPDGGGYWLVGIDGGVFAYGDAVFYGSMGGQAMNAPVAAIARTSDGHGYWLVSWDGGVFAFGDAAFSGSMGGKPLNALMIGIAANPDGPGYWTVAQDGGVFAFGGAPFLGSMANHNPPIQPVFGLAARG